MSSGIIVGKKRVDEELVFDSRKPRMQVALNRTPPHLDIQSVKGTALQVFAAGAHTAQETLLTVKHDLGYKPKVLVYFLQPDNERYAVGTHFYAFGAVDDYLTYTVDESNLFILHKVVDYLEANNFTSTAPASGFLKVRYMIFSTPVQALTDINKHV
jgi:hypothetical protein